MKLLKCKDGQLEMGNFFLTSSFFNFIGNSDIDRNIKNGTITLKSNTRIERKFLFNNFVIVLEKEDMQLKEDEYCEVFLSTDKISFGIKEDLFENKNKFWKIVKNDGYIQAYVSKDKINFENLGGMKQEQKIKSMGFKKFSENNFILNNYNVYSNPFFTIQNFAEGTLCELYNTNDVLLDAKIFNKDMECKFLLNYICNGYFVFKNKKGEIIYKSNIIQLSYGDVWILSPFDFEIIYKGNIIGGSDPTQLDSLFELVTIKNISKNTYKNIEIGIDNFSNDIVEVSKDSVNFNNIVKIQNFEGESEVNIFIRILRDKNSKKGFGVRNFTLNITGGEENQ
ncbi:hypothetical protein [Clostridium botulinum]|uniref:hypothetical protein n=1 Tax=Clostridium botulinum TaxID=1491 RepID=UPI001E2E33FE|nr:hypothetical protein [Clostridium botulinum]MCD3254349.1 hypothetical protein [Clostridium botulinum C/D]MCD3279849.1 hypothetical protein [Clostridium botulinum C/D]MCD3339580.1 hypothetical protein [Clostridium botulinum C/D]MCD3357488.1 hypothetical protein [Clostridium botulinum C/D]